MKYELQAERNAAIAEARRATPRPTLDALAAQYGLSRARIRQILHKEERKRLWRERYEKRALEP